MNCLLTASLNRRVVACRKSHIHVIVFVTLSKIQDHFGRHCAQSRLLSEPFQDGEGCLGSHLSLSEFLSVWLLILSSDVKTLSDTYHESGFSMVLMQDRVYQFATAAITKDLHSVAQTIENDFLVVLNSGSPKSRFRQVWFPQSAQALACRCDHLLGCMYSGVATSQKDASLLW